MISYKRDQSPKIHDSLMEKADSAIRSLNKDKALGFLRVCDRGDVAEKCEAIGRDLASHGDEALLFGIGGSALGPQFLAELFSKNQRKLIVCDNVDPVFLRRQWGQPERWRKGAFIIISKSGSTLETLAMVQAFHHYVHKVSPDWFKRAVVITEPGNNPLLNWAKENSVSIVDFPIDIGGRFSVLSPVGFVSSAFVGQTPMPFLNGARWALQQEAMVTDLVAQTLASFLREEWVTVFWSYSSQLRSYGAWMVQLWSESLAKKTNIAGLSAPRVSTPLCAIGATDQHSILQQMMEGFADKLVIVHRVAKWDSDFPLGDKTLFGGYDYLNGRTMGQVMEAEAQATIDALRSQGVSLLDLQLADLSAESVGALLMMWEIVVAGLGASLKIDAFDQPGVELGKRLAKQRLMS